MGVNLILKPAVALMLSIVASIGCKAQDCASVISGGRSSPPEWASDPNESVWSNSCYVDLGSNPDVAREDLEARCRSFPGFLAFSGDYGSGHNTCVYRQPDGSVTSAPSAPVASSDMADDPVQRRSQAEEATRDGDRTFMQGWGYLRSGDFSVSQAALNKSINDFFLAEKIMSKDQITLDPYNRGNEIPIGNIAKAARHSICLNSVAFDFDMDAKHLLLDSSINNTLAICREWVQGKDVSSYYLQRLKGMRSWERSGMVKTYQAPQGPLAPNSCVEVTPSHGASSACDFQEGVPMFETSMRVAPTNGCPTQLTAAYTTTHDQGEQKVALDTNYQRLWTCGSGPMNLHVVPN